MNKISKLKHQNKKDKVIQNYDKKIERNIKHGKKCKNTTKKKDTERIQKTKVNINF